MIAVIDYGAGNLGSVYKAFKYIGADVEVTADPAIVERADSLVLPGVGAFSHCMAGLASVHLTESTRAFIKSGRPFLGICVGLQMLFDESEEMGATAGLGILSGKVIRFRFDQASSQQSAASRVGALRVGARPEAPSGGSQSAIRNPQSAIRNLKVPHIGWNTLSFRPDAPLFQGLEQGDRAYFVHSYYPEPSDPSVIAATSEYGCEFCCAVQCGNVHATQFHPEKSGAVGLQILRNFTRLTA